METVTMSYEELDRASVIERVIERRLRQREAARMLGLTSRQVRRLRRAYERDGPGGLASRQRGRASNRRLTESALMKNKDITVKVLRILKGVGITVSIDDFGTGYSSLRYLKGFPVDAVKIDRSFVRDLTTDPDDAALTAAIISMAKALSLRTVAEGVEEEGQLAFLREHGCDEAQGYYFSKPLPAAEATEFLRSAHGSPEPDDFDDGEPASD